MHISEPTMAKQSKKQPPAVTKREVRMLDSVNLSDVNAEIVEKLRALRKQVGKTQKEFAESLGLDTPYVNGYESGRYSPSNMVLKKIALEYKVDMNWLYGLK